MKKIKILNPFAFILQRKERRFYEVEDKPVYKNGEYKTYRLDNKWYVTCRGNLIVTETLGIPKGLIEALVSGVEPNDYRRNHYHRALDYYEYAKDFAKQVGFDVK